MSEAELRVGVGVRTLVPGDPDDLDRLAVRFFQLGEGMLDSAWQLVTMDDKIWEGKAAEAFQHVISDEPRTFERAGTAFEDAARATRLWAVALREAQEVARQAIARFEEAEAVSRAWSTSAAESAQALDGADPGEEGRAEARRYLAQARADLVTPASRARGILGDAADLAPKKPGWFDRVTGGVGDFVAGAWDGASDVAGTLVGTVEAVLEDPGDFLLDTWDTLYDSIAVWNWDTFSSTWIAFGKEFLAWDEWAKNPLRALGRVAFNVALTWATYGAGKLIHKLLRRRKARGRAPPLPDEQLDELARDPDRGGEISEGSLREAEDVVGLERSGLIPGPVRRANGRVNPRESGADFVDATGQLWDHKLAVSGRQFEVNRYLDKLELRDIRSGENIILNHERLTPDDLKSLLVGIDERGIRDRFVFVPPL